MPMYAGIGGAVRELVELHAGVGGVVKELDAKYAGIGGVRKQIYQKQDTCLRYNVINQSSYEISQLDYSYPSGQGHTITSGNSGATASACRAKGFTFNTETGIYTLQNPETVQKTLTTGVKGLFTCVLSDGWYITAKIGSEFPVTSTVVFKVTQTDAYLNEYNLNCGGSSYNVYLTGSGYATLELTRYSR